MARNTTFEQKVKVMEWIRTNWEQCLKCNQYSEIAKLVNENLSIYLSGEMAKKLIQAAGLEFQIKVLHGGAGAKRADERVVEVMTEISQLREMVESQRTTIGNFLERVQEQEIYVTSLRKTHDEEIRSLREKVEGLQTQVNLLRGQHNKLCYELGVSNKDNPFSSVPAAILNSERK